MHRSNLTNRDSSCWAASALQFVSLADLRGAALHTTRAGRFVRFLQSGASDSPPKLGYDQLVADQTSLESVVAQLRHDMHTDGSQQQDAVEAIEVILSQIDPLHRVFHVDEHTVQIDTGRRCLGWEYMPASGASPVAVDTERLQLIAALVDPFSVEMVRVDDRGSLGICARTAQRYRADTSRLHEAGVSIFSENDRTRPIAISDADRAVALLDSAQYMSIDPVTVPRHTMSIAVEFDGQSVQDAIDAHTRPSSYVRQSPTAALVGCVVAKRFGYVSSRAQLIVRLQTTRCKGHEPIKLTPQLSAVITLPPAAIQYRFVACVAHVGGARGGHYVCYAACSDEPTTFWVFDDTRPTVETNVAIQGTIVCILYERRV